MAARHDGHLKEEERRKKGGRRKEEERMHKPILAK
jgi:hypothetical protein